MTTHSILLSLLLMGALVVLPGCRDDGPGRGGALPVHGPALTPETMPPGAKTFVLGQSTEADLLQVYSTAVRRADKSLGGNDELRHEDRPAITLEMTTRDHVARQAAADGVGKRETELKVARALNVVGDRKDFSFLRLWLVPDDSEIPRLTGIELIQSLDGTDDLCRWVEQTFGDEEEATRCPGVDQKLGKADAGVVYCVGDARGSRNVLVECKHEESLGTPSSRLAMWVH